MYKNLFIKAGLSKNESEIYEFLLKNGESPASKIILATKLKKGTVYIELENLQNKGLIQKKMLTPKNLNVKNKNKIAYFLPNHPEKLREFIQTQENEIITAKNNFEANLSSMVSDFNLVSGQPGIQIFEGINGIKQILADTLTAKEVIRTYADMDAIVKYLGKINTDYANQRDKFNIKKRSIILDTPFSRNYMKDYHTKTTDTKFIPHNNYPFKSVMQIYDKKISYINFSPHTKIGVIIHDPEIYQMNCSIFEHSWQNAKTYDEL